MKQLMVAGFFTMVASGCIFSGTSEPVRSGSDGGADTGIADVSVPENCGDGLLQPTELCDPGLPDDSVGACPSSCDDGIACTADSLEGVAAACTATCVSTVIEACANNDGCCPANCSPDNDTDCDPNVVCGDGSVDGAELCDPGVAAGSEGACLTDPMDCPAQECQAPILAGAAQNCDTVCAYIPITTCVDGDGCCATGCNPANDDDCEAMCGNDITELGETCDGNCPSACDDGDACTTDSLEGSAATCDAECLYDPISACADDDGCCPSTCDSTNDNDCSASCGNGTIESGETCDPSANCPTTCSDGDVCTTDTLTGSANNCNAACVFNDITTCSTTVSDGCCPAACNANNDVDCPSVCGNDIIEPGETCEANCPAGCNDNNACTTDTLSGDPDACTSVCMNVQVTSCSMTSDGCCPSNCNANNDADCGSVCGNQIVEPGETCDGNCGTSCNDNNACTADIAFGSASLCNFQCSYSAVTSCTSNDGCCPSNCNANNDSDCDSTCGNGIKEGAELCDGDCPTQADCSACKNFVGSAGTCDARCAPIQNCVTCDLNGDCNCTNGQICEGGKCVAATGSDCDRACRPDPYCEAFNANGWSCDGSRCVQCTSNTGCGPTQYCDQSGNCNVAPDCGEANDGNAWCAQQRGLDVCSNGECFKSCTGDKDCGPLQRCTTANICAVPTNCSDANDPSSWCADQQPGTDYCRSGECYRRCSDSGPNAACDDCLDPANEGCVPLSNGVPVCQDATLCGQICPANRDAWCSANSSGNACVSGVCI